MNYYEELGLERNATPAEIRQSYRTLVRLHHPDCCRTEPERREAEQQLTRLNGIVAVLSDPVAREKYDQSLNPSARVRKRRPGTRVRSRPAVWVTAVLLFCTGLVIVSSLLPKPAAPTVAASEVPALAATAEPAKNAPRRIPVQQRPEFREPARSVPQAVVAYATREPPRVEDPAPALPVMELPVQPIPPPDPLRLPVQPAVIGDWLYVSSPTQVRAGSYTPEYIELHVAGADGRIRGKYLARYRVPDQAISPTVAFQFEGPAAPESSELEWTGAGGSRGTVKLRLVAGNTMEVTWAADRLGKELGLISGTATLVRKRE